ncbi:MAG: hypothetical protein U9Q74_14335, partial [Gemmatimonadota bacterium]|nr:hypothetical protein [Gemmatimonadota bacterium]
APAGARTPAVNEALFERPVGFAIPCTGIAAAAAAGAAITPPVRAAQALARGDTAQAMAMLDGMDHMRSAAPGSPDNIEVLAAEVNVRAALHDTDGVRRILARFFNLLPAVPSLVVEQETWAALLGRLMAAHAEALAANPSSRADARRWAAAVAQLWSGADPGLAPVVARMRAIAGG